MKNKIIADIIGIYRPFIVWSTAVLLILHAIIGSISVESITLSYAIGAVMGAVTYYVTH